MAEVNFRSLSRNSMFAALAEVWRVGSRFILTPLIIYKLGLAGYGTWALIFSVCGYADVLNTSFGFAYSKFTAEYDRKKDYDGLSQIISSGIVLIGGLGLIGWGIVFAFRWPILRVLDVPEDLMRDATIALPLVATTMVMRISYGCFFQVLAGLQRMDLQHKLNILASIVEFGIAIGLLVSGWGLMALAFGHVAGQLLAMMLARWMCLRICPAIRFSPRRVTRFGLRHMLSLGGRFQLLAIMAMAITEGVKMLISATCGGPAIAGQYDLAEKLLTLAKSFSSSLIAPLMPAFAHLHAGQDEARKTSLFVSSSKLVAITAAAALVATAVFADPLLLAWTDQPCPLAAWTIRMLAAGYFFWLMTGVGTASLRGQGTVRLELTNAVMRTVLAAAVIAPLFISWGREPLYLKWGYEGIVIGVLISRVVSSVWFLATFSKLSGTGFMNYARGILINTILVGVAGTVLGFLFELMVRGWSPDWAPRKQAAFQVVVWGSMFGAALCIGLWYGVLTRAERSYFFARMPLIRGRWSKSPSAAST